MITKISRKECIELNPQLPISDYDKELHFFPKFLKSHILVSNLAEKPDELAHATADFFQLLSMNNLTFLGETELPWLSQNNEGIPNGEARHYFKEQKITAKFNGGIFVDRVDLAEFLKHLFILTRFSAAFPIVHFTDDDKVIVGSLCQYGHLHLFTLSETVENLLISTVEKSEFEFGNGIRC